jgi:two-component system response regulator AlgR
MKYLIVDDEPLAVMRLQRMLENHGITDIITASNGQKAVDAVEQFHPHVIFLDIEMPVLSGIKAAPIIKKISPESKIIFCTAYDEFAIQAFDLAASDYLLKPVSKERLSQALDKVIDSNQSIKRFSFHHGNDLHSITIDDIYCFVSEGKNTFMHCELGTIIIDESLVALTAQFKDQLLRINRNALINKTELCGIHRNKSLAYAKLKSTEYQPQISRRNLTAVKENLS